MEQKIDLEIRLRELAAQSMLEAINEIDILEVEKSLLTSDQRMNCYAIQLEQQRKQLSNISLSTDSGRGSKLGVNNRTKLINDVINANSNLSSQQQQLINANANNNNLISNDSSSPSFSSLLSNSQSPSKLSPVSGQSANSPSFTTQSSHHSRTGALRHSNTITNTNTNTFNSRNRNKNKKREQLLKTITNFSNINCNMVLNNRANISVSEIRIPLMWRDVDHFKGKGDYKRYAIFCLLKIDSQIYDTQLISDVDRDVTDVTFDDLVVFNEIDNNFELCLEVYSCVYLEQFSLTSTPRKLKEKLTNSVSKAMGRRLSTQTASINYTKELQAYDKSYRFAMIASAILKLDDASNTVKTYDLVLVSPSAHNRNQSNNQTSLNNSYSMGFGFGSTTLNKSFSGNSKEAYKNTLPLFGHFCCKLMVVPDVFDKNMKSGFIKLATITQNDSNNKFEEQKMNRINEKSNYSDHKLNNNNNNNRTSTMSRSNGKTYYAILRNFNLHLWQIDQERLDLALARGELNRIDNLKTPTMTININKYTRLILVSNSTITFEITGIGCFILSAYCSDSGQINQADEMGNWLRAIEQSIYDSHIWGSVLNHYPQSPTLSSKLKNSNDESGLSSIRNTNQDLKNYSNETNKEKNMNKNRGDYHTNRSILQADL